MDEVARQQLISELEDRFAPFISQVYAALQQQQFTFAEQAVLHQEHLDRNLIIRHALPYCTTEEAYFKLDNAGASFLASVILLHTLALTRMDDYYDGGKFGRRGMRPNIGEVAYSISATHSAVHDLLLQSPDAQQLAAMLNVTQFVHDRMYKDYTERYRPEFLDDPEKRLHRYLVSSHSRLLGSGYWEVMARAAFVRRGQAFPETSHQLDVKLRRFRQIIDELADIDEDIRGGLVTLPILHALCSKRHYNMLRWRILDTWQHEGHVSFIPALRTTGTYAWVYEQAMALYDSAMHEIDSSFGSRGDGYRKLFQYKKTKLDLLIARNM